MEPTIYKPSIYKGESIYNTGTGGGGSISNQIPQEFVYKNILGKEYKCVEIESGIFWPIENLNYIDENIELSFSFDDFSKNQCAYYNFANAGEYLFYNEYARNYINTIKNSTMKSISSTYFNLFLNYIKSKLIEWKGIDTHPSVDLCTTVIKDDSFDNYEDWLNLLNMGITVNGWYGRDTQQWSKTPYGYTKPVYFGVTSSPSYLGQFINVQYGKTIAFFSGDIGPNCYPMRFFIDEN